MYCTCLVCIQIAVVVRSLVQVACFFRYSYRLQVIPSHLAISAAGKRKSPCTKPDGASFVPGGWRAPPSFCSCSQTHVMFPFQGQSLRNSRDAEGMATDRLLVHAYTVHTLPIEPIQNPRTGRWQGFFGQEAFSSCFT